LVLIYPCLNVILVVRLKKGPKVVMTDGPFLWLRF